MDRRFFKVYYFIFSGEQYYFVFVVGQVNVDQFIVVNQFDCYFIGGMQMVEFGEDSFFYGIVSGCYEDFYVFFKFGYWQDCSDMFVLFQWQQVDDWMIVCVMSGFW